MASEPTEAGDILAPNQRQLGRYSLLRELRRDAASVTMLALDPVMHREVVLKAVRLPPPADGVRGADAELHALEQAFSRQAQAAGRLHHPHIVTVFEAARVHQIAFLAIERVNGRPLHELLAAGWRPDFVHCASLIARIADAIEYAHNQSIAHGHLGPQHVVVQTDGAPRVEGFGGWIDGGSGGGDALAHTEKLLPYFQNEVSEEMRRRDVQAIVTLLHLLLTGKPPQLRAPPEGGAPRPVSVLALRADVPPALARLVDEMLDPADVHRHRTAGDLRDALTAYIWNARKAHVAPATIGIPLAAPPEAGPDVAPAELTVRPQAPLASTVRAAANDATRPTTLSDSAPGPMSQLRTEILPGTGAARRAAPAPGARSPLLPWLRANRWALAGALALVVLGIALGMLLGRGARVAPATPEQATVVAAPSSASGVVRLQIEPWGEVFVNGKPIGVAPPLTELTLPVGRHNVEIRHGERTAVTAQIDVTADRPLLIQHRFE
jgi:serine/threonine-protein kinase